MRTKLPHLILATLLLATATPGYAVTVFTEDFSDNSAGPNMALGAPGGSPTTDFTGDFTITSGTGSRIYLGTNDTDYSNTYFIFEAEMTVPNTEDPWAIGFIGMGNPDALGSGYPAYQSPLTVPHLMMIIRNDNDHLESADDALDAITGNPNGTVIEVDPVTGIPNDTHLLRMTWNNVTQMALFEFDTGNDGSIDGSFTLDGSDNGFDASNSQLFIGGGNGLTFDNISVAVPEPSSSALLGLGGLALALRRRRS